MYFCSSKIDSKMPSLKEKCHRLEKMLNELLTACQTSITVHMILKKHLLDVWSKKQKTCISNKFNPVFVYLGIFVNKCEEFHRMISIESQNKLKYDVQALSSTGAIQTASGIHSTKIRINHSDLFDFFNTKSHKMINMISGDPQYNSIELKKQYLRLSEYLNRVDGLLMLVNSNCRVDRSVRMDSIINLDKSSNTEYSYQIEYWKMMNLNTPRIEPKPRKQQTSYRISLLESDDEKPSEFNRLNFNNISDLSILQK